MFWIENRTKIVTIEDEEFLMARYSSDVSFPRPGTNVHNSKAKFQLYITWAISASII